MNLDPMTSKEQAVAEQDQREDDTAREQAWAVAEAFARGFITQWLRQNYFDASALQAERDLEAVRALLRKISYGDEPHIREMSDFTSDYGVADLLGVIQRALK